MDGDRTLVSEMAMPETSVVIRAYNEEKHLPALFDGLAAQTYQDFETVVVDSGSFDMTREIARERADRLARIDQHHFTFGHSLNVGVQHGTGRFIAIVSAHTLPVDADWLAHLVKPLKDERMAMVYGRQMGRSDSKFSEFLDFERTFGPERKVLTSPDFFANNANSAVRRDLWEKHPFDEALPGLEDIEWAKYWMERGYQVVYEPAAGIYHIHAESWAQVRRRYYREGQAARWIGVHRRRDLPGDAWRETRYFWGDLARACRQQQFKQKAPEIARFRFEKLIGTVKGVWDGSFMDNPLKRQRVFFEKRYRALVIHGPGRASVEELELPPLKPGDVLIKVAYVGVCGTDLEVFEGRLEPYRTDKAGYPLTPGHEFSGRVVEVGANVKGICEGDRVTAECVQSCGTCAACRRQNWTACEQRQELGVLGLNGAYAEYVIVPWRSVHHIPEDVPLQRASVCELVAVALKGLKRLELNWKPDDFKRCVVVGAGSLGHLCAQILALRGHCVAVYDRDPARLSYFDGMAVQTRQALDDLTEFDALIDATGDPDVLDKMLHNSGPGSVLLLLGLSYARHEFNFGALANHDKTIIGSGGASASEFEEAVRLLPQLNLDAFIQKFFRLEEFEQAWSLFRQRRYLKIQMAIDDLLDRVHVLREDQGQSGLSVTVSSLRKEAFYDRCQS